MDTIKSIAASALVAILVCVGALSFAKPQALSGALAGPVIPSPFLQWGGVTRWSNVQQMQTGTSTLCAIQSPAATSSLKSFTVIFNSLPTYTTTYELGSSAAMNATTSAITASFTPAGNLNQFSATSTATAGVNDGIFAPNTWVNLNLSTSTASGASVAIGECTATFDQL